MSRIERILQAIIDGTSYNEAPQSRIEEILLAIKNDTDYLKSPYSRVETLLLAIKNNTDYSDLLQSRIEEILEYKLHGAVYEKDALSRIEKLLIDWIGKADYYELIGIPPLTFVSNGENLVDYRIYGASGGVGDRTENLFDGEWFTCGSIAQMAPVGSEYRQVVQPTPTLQSRVATKNLIKTTGTLRVACNKKYQIYLTYFDTRLKYTGNHSKDWQSSPVIAPFYGEYVSVAIKTENNRNLTEEELPEINLMVNTGGASLPYEPYGYKIPIVCGGTTTNIYLNEPLRENESISMSDSGVSIPTISGTNILTVDTAVQPSNVYLKYKGG